MLAMKQPRVINKAVIILSQYRILGNIHLHPGQRLSDFMNGIKDFLPVTDAQIFVPDGSKEIATTSLLEVNVRHILLLYPNTGDPLPREAEEIDEEDDEINLQQNDRHSNIGSMYIDPFKKS